MPQVGCTHNKLYGIKQVETAETIIQSLFAKIQLTAKHTAWDILTPKIIQQCKMEKALIYVKPRNS